MSDIKKFLDLDGLTTYDGKIKQIISDESAAGKAADKALKTFLGDPTGYPDENIPLYSETVNAASNAAADAAEAKANAKDAKDSAAASAAAAAASADEAANILGTPEDSSDDKTVYGVYSKVGDAVDNGLADIANAVNTGKSTIATASDNAVAAVEGSRDEAKSAISTDLTAAQSTIAGDLANAKAAIAADLENAQSAINGDLTSASETISTELTAATDAIDIAQGDAEAAIAKAKTEAIADAIDAVNGALDDAKSAISTDLTNAQSTIAGDLAAAKQDIIEATITATNTISADLTTAKQDITNAKTTATGAIDAAKTTAVKAVNDATTAATEAIDGYVEHTAKTSIDDYLIGSITPDIDNAKNAAVKDVNDAKTAATAAIGTAKTTALGEIADAVKPVTDAKEDATKAATAAKVAQAAAEVAANTATNAVTGFRTELGERPHHIDGTVWGNIDVLKSSVQGGVHFKGVFVRKPAVELDEDGTIVSKNDDESYDYWNTGDVIIITNAVDTLGEPTKEYILATDGDLNPYWVELGDVSPADQKITALETNKLNKSALKGTVDTLSDLESNNTFALVELTADDHAFVRIDTIIGAIPTSDIDRLFE